MQRGIFFFTLILSSLVLNNSFIAASDTPASISGVVKSSSSLPLKDVKVSIDNESQTAYTGTNGRFHFANINPGEHILSFIKEGYEEIERKIELRNNDSLFLEITLEVSTPVIVITSTRTETEIEDSPIPISVITKSEIRNTGTMRLNEILNEQAGLNISYFLGAGVQMQGLDPEYALILLDGEPLIGKNAGAIDLSRISLGNVKQIEIVKGPSSSLYGSDALSGVINIITQDPAGRLKTNLNARYGTFNTLDLSGDFNYKTEKLSTALFLNSYSSNGYDLTPATVSKTSPEFSTFTINPKIKFELNDKLNFELSTRYYKEKLDNIAIITGSQNNPVLFNDNSNLNDLNIGLTANYLPGENVKLTGRFYSSLYDYENTLKYQSDGRLFYEDKFKQNYHKAEILSEINSLRNNTISLGGGGIIDKVTADRLYDGGKRADSYFAFLQDQWTLLNNLNIVGGLRFDSHSDYSSRFSPKFSVYYKPVEELSVRTSYGAGFKAPGFQQLYLDFTNPQVGYTVLGTSGFMESFTRLQQNGEIADILINPSTVTEIKPENSNALNLELRSDPFDFITASVNFFRNDVNDLIEVLPVARKTNGQSVFTYFNLSKVYTQGLEANLEMKPVKNISLTVGYQYLEAKDKKVIEDIESGKIFKIGATGISRAVQLVEYGGLFNRPKHSGVVKIDYTNSSLDAVFTLRSIIKSRYGYADRNANGILDNDNEYAPGYAIWNFTVNKQFKDLFSVQAGIDNIFDKKSLEYTPELSGRIIYGGLSLNF